MDTSHGFKPSKFRNSGKVNIARLQSDAPKPPRYLIRIHTVSSQGAMTEDSFMSAAELAASNNRTLPSTIHNYDPVLFERHVHNHLTNYKGTVTEPFFSPFVSLTVSLRLALAWAQMRFKWGHSEVKIAVLDTTTIPRSNCDCEQNCTDAFHQNPIWPANMLYKACYGQTKTYPDEFLAFGHVRGIFKICTFAELTTNRFFDYLPELTRLPRGQKYEEIPATLASLWQSEQALSTEETDAVIHIARQLSNDNLLIPMVAFVLCVRRRSINDMRVLNTLVKAARLVEKKAMYDYLGEFDAFPIIDFFSQRDGQQIITADSVELMQTSAILEKVRARFAEVQEREALQMWNITTVALVSRRYCPKKVANIITTCCVQGSRSLKDNLAKAFKRLQGAVLKSKFSALRFLADELEGKNYNYNGLDSVDNAALQNEHAMWTEIFEELASKIEMSESAIQDARPQAVSLPKGVKGLGDTILQPVNKNVNQMSISDAHKPTWYEQENTSRGNIGSTEPTDENSMY